jgi:hypothetical protein
MFCNILVSWWSKNKENPLQDYNTVLSIKPIRWVKPGDKYAVFLRIIVFRSCCLLSSLAHARGSWRFFVCRGWDRILPPLQPDLGFYIPAFVGGDNFTGNNSSNASGSSNSQSSNNTHSSSPSKPSASDSKDKSRSSSEPDN